MSVPQKAPGFLEEFKHFIARGNVMDMAVGVIVGSAFKGIADSLVADIISPILGIFAGDSLDLSSSLVVSLPGGGDLKLGSFFNTILSFLITAFVVFCLVKALSQLQKRLKAAAPPPAPSAPPSPSRQEVLLEEILAELKKGRG